MIICKNFKKVFGRVFVLCVLQRSLVIRSMYITSNAFLSQYMYVKSRSPTRDQNEKIKSQSSSMSRSVRTQYWLTRLFSFLSCTL